MVQTGERGLKSKPLAGKRILLLRTRAQAAAILTEIEALGGEAILYPVIQIADPMDWGPLDQAIRQIEAYQWLVITSPNGAERFAARLLALGRSGADLTHLRVVAVGQVTADALAQQGIRVDLLPESFRGKAIPPAMAPDLQPGDRVLIARGDLGDPALVEGLLQLGAQVDDRILYRTLPSDGVWAEGPTTAERLTTAEGAATGGGGRGRSALAADRGDGGPSRTGATGWLRGYLAAGEIDYVAFTSGSTVRHLLGQLGGPDALGRTAVACIGPETAAVAEGLGLTVACMANPHTMAGLLQAVLAHIAQKEM